MPERQPDAYALLEASFQDVPKLKSHKPLPRHRDELRSIVPERPLTHDYSYANDETLSQDSSEQDLTPLASPGAVNRAETGLPPTPPSNVQDEKSAASFERPSHADGVLSSLMSKKSSLSTPVNQRSPPTPDPSPPRTTESMMHSERPPIFAYPSSRAESFTTAKEDQNSEGGNTRTSTPLASEGLGLAFERKQQEPPRKRERAVSESNGVKAEVEMRKGSPDMDNILHREWDSGLMRNVTVRKKRNPHPSPQTNLEAVGTASPATKPSPRRASGLRERVKVSNNSPITTSIENFAYSIGWPSEAHGMPRDQHQSTPARRLSGSSMASAVVEAMVIVTPPGRERKLRHSGKNLAYRGDGGSSDYSSTTHSNRNSMNSDDMPLHRLLHKPASLSNRRKRVSSESGAWMADRTASPLMLLQRSQENAAYTFAHQESVRNILQPAAELLIRSNSANRNRSQPTDQSSHKRISSAPEPSRRAPARSPLAPRTFLELSPPDSPKEAPAAPLKAPRIERTSPSTPGFQSHEVSPVSPKWPTVDPVLLGVNNSLDLNKSLPHLPIQSTDDLTPRGPTPVKTEEKLEENAGATRPITMIHRPEERDSSQPPARDSSQPPAQDSPEFLHRRRTSSSGDGVPLYRRGSLSIRGRSEERRRSSLSQDRTSTSRDTLLHPGEDLPRHSHESYSLHPDDHRRVSFDQSTIRTEEHAMARHSFAQTTPFSQISDTPIEVSEATAVSIYPHNNHSLLVVQHPTRSNTFPLDGYETHALTELTYGMNLPTSYLSEERQSHEKVPEQPEQPSQPRVMVEPSTPPMQIILPAHGAVDSPLKNPRQAPEPPVFMVIPPTPAAELERQLAPSLPGPPKHSDSHPQRRLSLVQRARRYSETVISPFLARSSSQRSRYASDPHAHRNPQVPTVSDEEGTLHPFWRPRGFWDGFEDSDSESDDGVLPLGGDTSDVEPDQPESNQNKISALSRKLTNKFKAPEGFLIGNSLGVERSGTNKRRPVVEIPSRRRTLPTTATTTATTPESPSILIQAPTIPIPLRSHSPRIEKRTSQSSVRSGASGERPRRKRESWRVGKTIPGLGMQVQYIGISGVKERFREKRKEKRREEIRKSIGSRFYHEAV
ncbi:hypothetical protein P154DRAFT_431533 [Amniculicola lignicola CBS 123094]|uniref:Uncharacterized protein n=1 Tax=Amniculicola lignicola CBS 123094 TaxID=1392246 RepID=A0A6A5WN42_9PLEO|nr:hypothetical protein P154DRAFT_431533 [Amniculicola lignicola CBS 123094]